jgi:hypothetical protein
MKVRQWITGVALLGLVVATIISLFLTDNAQTVFPNRTATDTPQAAPVVDQKPLQTARKLAALASTQKRLVMLRAVVWFAVQAVGVLLIAFVIFGMPNRLPPSLVSRALDSPSPSGTSSLVLWAGLC